MQDRLTGPDQSSPQSQTAPHPQPQSDSVRSKEQQVSLAVCSLQYSGKGKCHDNVVQKAHQVFVTVLMKKEMCTMIWFRRSIHMGGLCRHWFKIRLMQVQ